MRVDKLQPFEKEEEQTTVFDEVENVHGCLVNWEEGLEEYHFKLRPTAIVPS